MATGPAASFRRRRLGRPAMSHTISIQGSARILRRLKCVTVRGVPTEGGGDWRQEPLGSWTEILSIF